MINAISGGYSNYSYYGNYGNTSINASGSNPINPDAEKKAGKVSSPEECQTCKSRKYQDGSNEADVSFKSAAHVSPSAAGAAVRTHEGMHVTNAYEKAAKGNGKVLQASVAIQTSVCPECGRTYVSGGTTTTKIAYPNESNPYQQSRKSQDSLALRGANLNLAV